MWINSCDLGVNVNFVELVYGFECCKVDNGGCWEEIWFGVYYLVCYVSVFIWNMNLYF